MNYNGKQATERVQASTALKSGSPLNMSPGSFFPTMHMLEVSADTIWSCFTLCYTVSEPQLSYGCTTHVPLALPFATSHATLCSKIVHKCTGHIPLGLNN
jgi:hypothetical protein